MLAHYSVSKIVHM